MTILLGSLIIATLFLAGFAAWSDFRSLRIPNIIPACLLLLFLSAIILQEFILTKPVFYTSLSSQLFAGLVVFSVTAILFSLNMLGAGDSKLLTVLALWTGFHGLPALIFWMAFFGGVLALATLIIRRKKPFKPLSQKWIPQGSWIIQVQEGRNAVPYGIAIFAGLVFAYGEMGYFTAQFWSG